MKELYDKARKRLPEVKAANVAGAYRVWSGAVSDLLPTGMTAAPGKHPDHGKMVCYEIYSIFIVQAARATVTQFVPRAGQAAAKVAPELPKAAGVIPWFMPDMDK